MPHFMRDGGIGMWFILLFGAITFAGAVLFARRPDEWRLGTLRAMTITTLLSSFTAFTAGLAKSTGSVTRIPAEMHDRWPMYALKGFSESCANLIFGFTWLTLAWMVIAIGQRRLAAAKRAHDEAAKANRPGAPVAPSGPPSPPAKAAT
jgi:hypothetical protein